MTAVIVAVSLTAALAGWNEWRKQRRIANMALSIVVKLQTTVRMAHQAHEDGEPEIAAGWLRHMHDQLPRA